MHTYIHARVGVCTCVCTRSMKPSLKKNLNQVVFIKKLNFNEQLRSMLS